jgi:hypothetical protein
MPPTDSALTFDSADLELEGVAARFFEQAPHISNDFDERPAKPLSRTQRRAMGATFAMLGVFAVALTVFLIYSRVIMPLPAELAAERGLEELEEPSVPEAAAAN